MMTFIADWPQAAVAMVALTGLTIIVIVAWASRSKVWEQVQILQRQINALETALNTVRENVARLRFDDKKH
jgi:hypothetical protein